MMLLIALLATALPYFAAGAHRRVGVDLWRLVTCNDDWASLGSNMLELLAHDPDAIFIQEGKRANYARMRYPRDYKDAGFAGKLLFPRDEYGVYQDRDNPAVAGSVVIYKLDRIHVNKAGLTFAVKARGILARYIAWVRGYSETTKRRIFLFSAHRPPVRVKHWWHPFDVALWARLRMAMRAKRLIMGGMDSNEHGGPGHLPQGLKWVGISNSIDGFVLSVEINVRSIVELPRGTSDHHPVLLEAELPAV